MSEIVLDHSKFLEKIHILEQHAIKRGVRPLACVIVNKSKGEIIGEAHHMVELVNESSLHSEIMAINHACHYLRKIDLSDCVLYSSCQPCPICLAAIYWAKIDTVYYKNSKEDDDFGCYSKFIYDELIKPKEDRKIKMNQIS
jgi:tRNA(Arg) A34 adenosine deaminase TadA